MSSTRPSTSSCEMPAIGSSRRITRDSPARTIASSSLRLSPWASAPPARTHGPRARRVPEPSPPARVPAETALRDARVEAFRPAPPPRRVARSRAAEQERKHARDLERPPEPGARSRERGLTRSRPGRRSRRVPVVGCISAREQIEERRLPRAVRADDADELALPDLERDIGDDAARRRCRARGSRVARIGVAIATAVLFVSFVVVSTSPAAPCASPADGRSSSPCTARRFG